LAETNNFIIIFQFYNTTGSSLKKVGGEKGYAHKAKCRCTIIIKPSHSVRELKIFQISVTLGRGIILNTQPFKNSTSSTEISLFG